MPIYALSLIALAKYTVTASRRDRVFLFLLGGFVAALSLSLFVTSLALIEKSSFALAATASSLRFLSGLGVSALVCFHVRRLFEGREMIFWLSAPQPRGIYPLGLYLGYAIVAVILSVAAGAVLSVLAIPFDLPFKKLVIWTAGVATELLITGAFALFVTLVLRSSLTALFATIGFYVLSRMSGILIGILSAPRADELKGFMALAYEVMGAICHILPRFDLLAETSVVTMSETSFPMPLFLWGATVFVYPLLFLLGSWWDLMRQDPAV